MTLNRKFALPIIALTGFGLGSAAAAAPETAVTTPTTAAAAPADRWQREPGSLLVAMLMRAAQQLNLSDEQQQSMQTVVSNFKAQHQADQNGSGLDLTVLGNPGDPKYAAAVQNAKTLAAQRIQRESELQSQLYNVLTPEQKAKLPQVLADMKAQMERSREAWRHRVPAIPNPVNPRDQIPR